MRSAGAFSEAITLRHAGCSVGGMISVSKPCELASDTVRCLAICKGSVALGSDRGSSAMSVRDPGPITTGKPLHK